MPIVSQPGGLPVVGSLYNDGIQNGQVIYTQPGGPGTLVYPQFPQLYPQVPERPQSFPQTPFVFAALFSFGCGHWANIPEVFKQFNIYTDNQAALCCCPMCGYIQLIVEPADDWWQKFFTLYNTGLATGVHPTW